MAQIEKVWVFYVQAADSPKGYARFLVAGPPVTNDPLKLEAATEKAKSKRPAEGHVEIHTVSYNDAVPPQGQERQFSESARFFDKNGESMAASKAEVESKRAQLIEAVKRAKA